MTRAQTGAIEAAVLDVLYRAPQSIGEACTALHRRDALPPYWGYANVGAVIRRLHARGVLHRLDHPGVSRTVLWWAG